MAVKSAVSMPKIAITLSVFISEVEYPYRRSCASEKMHHACEFLNVKVNGVLQKTAMTWI